MGGALSIVVVGLLVSGLAGCSEVVESPTSTSGQAPRSASVDDVIAAARPAVVKVRAVAPSCQKILEGTGFVAAANKVMTLAHVVAGGETVTVEAEGATYEALVVSYDPTADIAVLHVGDLPSAPLTFNRSSATAGTDALVLGYPGGETFEATEVEIREITRLKGPDIYRTTSVSRQVYLINGTAHVHMQGLSGGPLITMDGRVLGVVFGQETHDRDIGFALTAAQVMPHLAALDHADAVQTGDCVH
jgi:S1-C subfamily serine protease